MSVLFHGRPQFDAWTASELRAAGADGPRFTVTEPFRIDVEGLGAVVVPRGTVTDWASIPAWARAYLADDDARILCPSLLHDFGYEKRGLLREDLPPLTRAGVDDLLRRGMLACFASAARARTVYLAVRLGGGARWGPTPKQEPAA